MLLECSAHRKNSFSVLNIYSNCRIASSWIISKMGKLKSLAAGDDFFPPSKLQRGEGMSNTITW